MKFLVIGTKTNVEVYAWAQKPYSKFMAFKSFTDLPNRPLLVDMIHLPGGKSKVIYASTSGFHSVDLETGVIQNIYVPVAAGRGPIIPHAIIPLPSKINELLLCHDNEGVYVDGDGHPIKDIRLQWGEEPSSVGKLPVVRLLYHILHRLCGIVGAELSVVSSLMV
jgi:misshapen/NIK-related kinase